MPCTCNGPKMLVNILWFLSPYSSITCVSKSWNPHQKLDRWHLSPLLRIYRCLHLLWWQRLSSYKYDGFCWDFVTCWVYNEIWSLFYETFFGNFKVHFVGAQSLWIDLKLLKGYMCSYYDGKNVLRNQILLLANQGNCILLKLKCWCKMKIILQI